LAVLSVLTMSETLTLAADASFDELAASAFAL
jgi:hypothetical protein